jgi:quercetin dioxygenase-like cupin family protein
MKVEIRRPHEISWTRIGDLIGAESPGTLTVGELDSSIGYAHHGDVAQPALYAVSYVPDAVVAPHSHDGAQIVYVLEGELHWGRTVLEPGSSVFIPGGVAYGYRAGPQGLRTLNFRPTADRSFHPKA